MYITHKHTQSLARAKHFCFHLMLNGWLAELCNGVDDTTLWIGWLRFLFSCFFFVFLFRWICQFLIRMNWWSITTIKYGQMEEWKRAKVHNATCERKREELVVCHLLLQFLNWKQISKKKCYSCCGWHFAILCPFTVGITGPIKWKLTWVYVWVCLNRIRISHFLLKTFWIAITIYSNVWCVFIHGDMHVIVCVCVCR